MTTEKTTKSEYNINCSICKNKIVTGYGHYCPVSGGRCCNVCFYTKVLPCIFLCIFKSLLILYTAEDIK